MSVRYLPFYLLVLSIPIPLFIGLFDSPYLSILIELIVFYSFFFLVSSVKFEGSKVLWLVSSLVVVVLSLISKNELGAPSVFLTSLLVFAFYFVLRKLDLRDLEYVSTNYISFYLLVNVLFISIDNVSQLFGYSLLFEYLEMNYRGDLISPFSYFLPYSLKASPSLWNGPQAASMLALFSLLWFTRLFHYNYWSTPLNAIFLIFLIFIAVYNATMTSSVMFFISIFVLSYYKFYNRRLLVVIFSIIFFVVVMLFPDIVFFKLHRFESDGYLGPFLSPIVYMYSLMSLEYFLFGIGSSVQISSNVINADFGLIMILLYDGVLFFLFFLCSFFGALGFFNLRVKRKMFSRFISINEYALKIFVMSLLLFISLLHYTVAIWPGARIFFALCIAITMSLIRSCSQVRIPVKCKRP